MDVSSRPQGVSNMREGSFGGRDSDGCSGQRDAAEGSAGRDGHGGGDGLTLATLATPAQGGGQRQH